MSCPVHIWVPMMAALTPVAQLVRGRLAQLSPAKAKAKAKAKALNPARRIPEMARWSAIGDSSGSRVPGAAQEAVDHD